MIELGSLSESEVGLWVVYRDPYAHKTDRGRIKSWNHKWIFVVYRCAGNWHDFQNYTGVATDPAHLTRLHETKMDAESEQVERLKANIAELLLKHEREKNILLASLEAAMITIKGLKNPEHGVNDETFETMNEIYMAQISRRNQIIRELMAWIDSEFRLDTYLPESPGKKLWDRAQEAISK